MKNIVTIWLLICFSNVLNAQISKGSFMVGGTFAYTYRYFGDFSYNYHYIGVNSGYFIFDKMALGVNFRHGGSLSNWRISSSINNATSACFARYYLLKPEKQYNLFIEPSLNIPLKNFSTGYSIAFGQVVFLNESVGLQTYLNYEKHRMENRVLNFNQLSLVFALQIHIN